MNDLPKRLSEECETGYPDGAWRRVPSLCAVDGISAKVWDHLYTKPLSVTQLIDCTKLDVRTVRRCIDALRKHIAVWWWRGGFYVDSCQVPDVSCGRRRWKRRPGSLCPNCGATPAVSVRRQSRGIAHANKS